MQEFEIVFYDKLDGSEPVKDFLNSMDTKMLAKTVRTIELLQNNGTALRKPYSSSLGDGIFELRIKVGSDITRVLYFFYVGHKVILTNGLSKKHKRHLRMKSKRRRAVVQNISRGKGICDE